MANSLAIQHCHNLLRDKIVWSLSNIQVTVNSQQTNIEVSLSIVNSSLWTTAILQPFQGQQPPITFVRQVYFTVIHTLLPVILTADPSYLLLQWYEQSPQAWTNMLVSLMGYSASSCFVECIADFSEAIVACDNLLDIVLHFLSLDQVFGID